VTIQCPFCGVIGYDDEKEGNIFSFFKHDYLIQVECSNCEARGPSALTKKEAIEVFMKPILEDE
jgi:hypothetical protein